MEKSYILTSGGPLFNPCQSKKGSNKRSIILFNKKDKCTIAKCSGNQFYFTIYVHKNYSEMQVVVEALNLAEVVCIADNCGGKVIQGGSSDGE